METERIGTISLTPHQFFTLTSILYAAQHEIRDELIALECEGKGKEDSNHKILENQLKELPIILNKITKAFSNQG